jgi:predicted ATP-dependent endonuclease of OLD family
MRLIRAEITNYRSVKSATIGFEPACRILVGINESGKSNILNALSLLSDDVKPTRATDVRDSLPDEAEVEDSYVKFYFHLEKPEADGVFDSVSKTLLATAHDPQIASVSSPVKFTV